MAKANCFICNRKIHPKKALKRNNQTFDRQVLLCSQECYEEDKAIDEMCKDMSAEEARKYFIAVNIYFPDTLIHSATCLDCKDYKSSSCEGFLAEPLECMTKKARELEIKSKPRKTEKFRRW